MKKSIVPCLMMLMMSEVAFGKTCAIDVNKLNIACVRIGQTDAAFFAQHPTAKSIIMPINNYQIELADNSDEKLKSYGVTGIGHIGYNPKTHLISSFSFSFLDGGLATYDTSLNLFKNRILNKFNLPKSGWKKVSDSKYQYRCKDYNIAIVQDHGAEHTAVGPTVMVFSRYMTDWKEFQK